jgi:hypothetical protein
MPKTNTSNPGDTENDDVVDDDVVESTSAPVSSLSAVKTLRRRISGISPILLHNSRLSDPLFPLCKAMRLIHDKKAKEKTDIDHAVLAHLEWSGGMYHTGSFSLDATMTQVVFTDDARVIIPGEMIEGLMKTASAKRRMRKQFEAALISDGTWNLIYDGPKNINELAKDPNFSMRASAQVNKSRVQRTRPIFRKWAVEFEVTLDTSIVNEVAFDEVLALGGRLCGLGTWRPRYGRYVVEAIN